MLRPLGIKQVPWAILFSLGVRDQTKLSGEKKRFQIHLAIFSFPFFFFFYRLFLLLQIYVQSSFWIQSVKIVLGLCPIDCAERLLKVYHMECAVLKITVGFVRMSALHRPVLSKQNLSDSFI